MKRFALDELVRWKGEHNRKPLIIRGARQVGKTELVRIFARQEFESLIEINFDEHPSKASIFMEEDITSILTFLEIDANTTIRPGKTLLFLDEIQGAPQVLAKLRYFYERVPDLHIICAGSLLDFALTEPSFSMPVGRIEFMYLGPMTFGEFLLARGQERLFDFLEGYTLENPIPETIHKKLLALLREYFLIGGLPGVIRAYIESDNSLDSVSSEQQSILQTYYADFSKYKRRVQVAFLQSLFKKIPTHIGSTVKYASLYPDTRADMIREHLDLQEKARIIYRIFHSDGNGIPLGAEINARYFKLQFLDIGLVSALLGLRITDLMMDSDFTLIHSGSLAEQFVGQHLLYAAKSWEEPELYYWNRPSKGSTAEVDFLISLDGTVIPVEVKAGKTGRLKSLQMFIQEKGSPIAVRFNSDIPTIYKTKTSIALKEPKPFTLLSLPLYLVEQTARLVRTYL